MTGMDKAAGMLAAAERVVVFTGAGISAESGIPNFRDALTGLWARYDAQQLATPTAFHNDPDLVWGWYEWRREAVRRVEPNDGHRAVAAIERCVVITQNVDDLHERAGSRSPIHLHGSLFEPRCSACGLAFSDLPEHPVDSLGEGRRLPPPTCGRCGAPVRPGVVWFGEALPTQAFEAAVEAAANADVLLTVGTSGVVYPAAEIPQVTARLGGHVIQINPKPTPLDEVATVNLTGPAAKILPALVEAAWPDRPGG
jgi:NAD-dependent protein deacetylase/lipoamidase